MLYSHVHSIRIPLECITAIHLLTFYVLGVATGVIFLSNSLEQWDNRFNTLLHGSNPLPDQEWLRFYQMLDEWSTSLDETIAIIGNTQKEDQKREGVPHKEWVQLNK